MNGKNHGHTSNIECTQTRFGYSTLASEIVISKQTTKTVIRITMDMWGSNPQGLSNEERDPSDVRVFA
jgi:hypothetical protein